MTLIAAFEIQDWNSRFRARAKNAKTSLCSSICESQDKGEKEKLSIFNMYGKKWLEVKRVLLQREYLQFLKWVCWHRDRL